MQVIVKTPEDSKKIECAPNDTILLIKQKIEKLQGTPVKNQVILFEGEVMNNARMLGSLRSKLNFEIELELKVHSINLNHHHNNNNNNQNSNSSLQSSYSKINGANSANGNSQKHVHIVKTPREKKDVYLKQTVKFIQTCGKQLKVPVFSTVASAIVFLHKFYRKYDFSEYDRFKVATSCLFLAGKTEETPIPLDTVIKVCMDLCKSARKEQKDENYVSLRESIIALERRILQAINFLLKMEHPYKFFLSLMKPIKEKEGESSKKLAQAGWNCINDCFQSSIILDFKPFDISVAAIHLAKEYCIRDGISFKNDPIKIIKDYYKRKNWKYNENNIDKIQLTIKKMIFSDKNSVNNNGSNKIQLQM